MLLVFETLSIFLVYYYFSLQEVNCLNLKQKWVNKDNTILLFACVIVFIIALRRENDVSDYWNYRSYYENSEKSVEPAFKIIAFICRDILRSPVSLLMFCFASFSVYFKTISIKEYSSFVFVSFLIYVSDFLLLHDFIQIRTGVASSLMLYSIKYIKEKRLSSFFLIFCVAVSFHYSAILMFPLFFLDDKKINIKMYFYVLIILYIWAYIKINPVRVLEKIPISYISEKAHSYLNRDEHYAANVFGLMFSSKVLVTFLLSLRINLLSEKNPYFILMLKIQYISLYALLFFSQNMAAAMRISEFFGVMEILLFPEVINLFEEKHFARFCVSLLACCWLVLRIFVYHNISW